MLRWLGGVMLVLVIGGLGSFWFVCPCEQIPGGPLAGDFAPAPVQDWSFVNEAGLCQLQVDRGIPWSINLNCMSSDGVLYVSCSQCASKAWSQAALERPDGVLRVRETLYPVRMQRVIQAQQLDQAWQARAKKLGRGKDSPRPDHWWSFELSSRQST